MINDVWTNILRLIPAEQHNTVMIMTKAGIELSVEVVFRMEPSYLVMRGRLAGTTDMGRVFFIPFCEVNYIYLNRVVAEEEVRAFYGEGTVPQAKPLTTAEPAPEPQPEAAPPAPTAASAPAPAPSSVTPLPGRPTASDPATAAKVNLLERIRAARASAVIPRPGA